MQNFLYHLQKIASLIKKSRTICAIFVRLLADLSFFRSFKPALLYKTTILILWLQTPISIFVNTWEFCLGGVFNPWSIEGIGDREKLKINSRKCLGFWEFFIDI